MKAAIALRSFGRDASPAVPALLQSLSRCVEGNSDWTAREIAATLAVTGDPRAKEALPAIEQLLAEETATNTREELSNAIKTIQAF